MNAHVDKFYDVEGQTKYATLPKQMFRGEVEGLLIDIQKQIGISGRALFTLLTLIRSTRPSDWTDEGCDPVCYAKQTDIAAQLGCTDRAIRNHEKQFVALGLIDKDVAANGSRCRLVYSDGSEFRQGLSFGPLIQKVPGLLQIREQMQFERKERVKLKRQCSAVRRTIKNIIMELQPKHPDNSTLQDIVDEYLSWPTRYDVFRTLESLEEHLNIAREYSEKLCDLQKMLNKYSGRTEPSFRPYIQDTTYDLPVICNDTVSMQADCKQSDNKSINAQPNGRADCLEKEFGSGSGESNKFLETLHPNTLLNLCSDDMQPYIKYHQAEKRIPVIEDFILAAIDRLHDLGINKSAYNAAVEQMGDLTTAICIIIIDSNRDHPVTPVRNAGGLLRVMTKRHANKQLNLVGSLIGLSERKKQQ